NHRPVVVIADPHRLLFPSTSGELAAGILLFSSGPVSQLTEPVAAPCPQAAVIFQPDEKIVARRHVFPIRLRADLSWRTSNLQCGVTPQTLGPVPPHPHGTILFDSCERLPARCYHTPVTPVHNLSRQPKGWSAVEEQRVVHPGP